MCRIVGYEFIDYVDKKSNERKQYYLIHIIEELKKNDIKKKGCSAYSLFADVETFQKLQIGDIYEKELNCEIFYKKGGKSLASIGIL